MKVNNIRFNVKVAGDGIPFIWGHGLTLSMAFEDTAGWFQWPGFGQDVRLVRYDARGHGGSEATYAPEDYHWSNLATDMIGIADGLGSKTFIAGGQSMGCATSIYAALAAPERIKALVLVNPPTAWETRAARSAIFDKLAGLVEEHGAAALADMMQKQPLWPDWLLAAQPEVNGANSRAIRMMSDRVLPQVLRGAKLCDLPDRRELKRIAMPTLILAWVEDGTHPVSTAEELGSLLPQSRLVVANDPHEVKLWPQTIRDFVRSVS